MRVNLLVVVPVVAFAALAAAFALTFAEQRAAQDAGREADTLPSTMVGREAPGLRLVPLGDGPVLTDDVLRQPGVKLVNYWASWCAPCRAEHPTLTALAAEGVPIYGINYKDDPAKALAFLADLGNPYAALGADSNGRTAIDWGLYGVPETFVIDGQGRVVLRFAGPVTERSLESEIRPAIARATAGE